RPGKPYGIPEWHIRWRSRVGRALTACRDSSGVERRFPRQLGARPKASAGLRFAIVSDGARAAASLYGWLSLDRRSAAHSVMGRRLFHRIVPRLRAIDVVRRRRDIG